MDQETTAKTFTFQDAQGASWDVTLNLLAARRVDNSDFSEITDQKFSLLKPSRELFSTILSDTPLVFAIVWAIVQPQAREILGIDPKEDPEGAESAFLARMDGNAIKAGRDAFWRALAGFFPEHQTALLTLVGSLEKANQRIGERIRMMGGDLDEMLGREIDREMEKLKQKAFQEIGT